MKINGERLKQEMHDQYLSLSEVANAVGVSVASVSKWRNEKKSISERHLCALAKLLNIDSALLVKGSENGGKMTREEARLMTVQQFIDYMGDEEYFQVCFRDDEWEEYVELKKDSKFLKPFGHCKIDCMGAELMNNGKDPVIRISIDDSNMVYL